MLSALQEKHLAVASPVRHCAQIGRPARQVPEVPERAGLHVKRKTRKSVPRGRLPLFPRDRICAKFLLYEVSN